MKLNIISEVQYKQPSTDMSRYNQGSQYNKTDFNPETSTTPLSPVANPIERKRQDKLEYLYNAEKKNRGSSSVSGKYVIEFDPDVTEETRDRFLVKLLNEIHSANGEMTIISQCDG